MSARATLDLEDAFYDRASGTVTANVYLVNSSEDTLRAPLFVRVLSLTSAMGRPTITNADRGGPGPGAVLDFASLIEGGSLAPGARSSARRVVFVWNGRKGPRNRKSGHGPTTKAFPAKTTDKYSRFVTGYGGLRRVTTGYDRSRRVTTGHGRLWQVTTGMAGDTMAGDGG